jgi:hypothetical protein
LAEPDHRLTGATEWLHNPDGRPVFPRQTDRGFVRLDGSRRRSSVANFSTST